MMKILDKTFFERDCLEVAPDLVGKIIARETPDGIIKLRISETEAYRGETDTACHARFGRTKRSEVLYMDAGTIYVYLCYGLHWLFNIVTERENIPQAVLIRACIDADGPAKLTKKLGIDGKFNRANIYGNGELYIADDGEKFDIVAKKRVGIDYADEKDRNKLWRFCMKTDK